MSDPTPSTSDLSAMENYLVEHIAPPSETSERRVPSSRAQTPEKVPEPQDDGDEGDEGDDGLDLDERTLEALGLTPARPKPKAGQDDDGEEDGADEQDRVDLGQLAKVLGISSEDLSYDKDKGVIVKTKVDGETAQVSLDELRKGYQLQKHFTRQQEQFLAEQKRWEAERDQAAGKIRQQAELAAQVLQQEEVQLKQAYTLDWDTLRKEDPAEYAALVAEYNQKLAGLRQRQNGLVQTFQQQMQEQQQAREQKRREMLQREQEALVNALGWEKPEERKTNAQRLQTYLHKEGFTEEALGSITDHRAFILAEKARKYDDLMAKIATAKKKVTEAPAMPADRTAPKPKSAAPRKRLDTAMNRLRRDHSISSAAEVFKHLKVV